MDPLDALARWLQWLLTGVYPPPLEAPDAPTFTLARRGTTLELRTVALPALPEAGLSYRLTVTPAGGRPIVQTALGEGAPVFPNLPPGAVAYSLVIVDAQGDAVSPEAQGTMQILAAPAPPKFTVGPDRLPS